MVNLLLGRTMRDDWVKRFNPEKRLLTGRAYLFVKRMMDLVIVFASAIFWLPLMGLIALIIRVTSPGGRVFFVQD